MRRAPIVIASTAAGLAGVLAYHPRTVATSAASAAAPTATTASATTTGSSAGGRAATGPVEQISENGRPFGQIQVRATVKGGVLTGVSIVQLTPSDGRSQSIDDYAVPQLVQESLSAGSARVEAISGATYTSAAYAASLQAAMDSLT